MKLNLNTIEPFLLVALTAAATETDDDIEGFFAKIGDKLNDTIESTATQLDDFAKVRLNKGLKALSAQLDVDGVDGPVGEETASA